MVNSIPPDFFLWVAGDLTGNRLRGLYAEWMLSSELGLTADRPTRVEWDMVDIRYRGLNIEVKTSGNRQQWSSEEKPVRFSIAPQSRIWNATLNESRKLSPPTRTADIYVFCLHRCDSLSTSTVVDESKWTFMVVPTSRLDATLGPQRTISASSLSTLGHWVPLSRACDEIRRLAH